MTYIRDNLFNSPFINDQNTKILHCISADYALGAGFAAEIERRYAIRGYLKTVGKGICPDIIAVDNIINLVTKQYYWNKPTYENFDKTLIMAREYCLSNNINRLIMPTIGCGLDKLNWEYCSESIKYLIDEFDIDCIIYYMGRI